jgi:hypothetical protein
MNPVRALVALCSRLQLAAAEGDALRLMHDELPRIPLYRRTLAWVMLTNIVQWQNDAMELRWVRIGRD